ncbi:hypothetical protein QTL95_27000 [Rhizobium sp. S152]|uniref:hypothetical protein n=1 Tax=Rhizobium sp. S152 TaxID=3055038 RepID=UPI0025AA2918|nr:hypothetical protein [Rhizobium sp. S152]MDM9629537.1 hypothetical protein [Rhizobium sp. S152]
MADENNSGGEVDPNEAGAGGGAGGAGAGSGGNGGENAGGAGAAGGAGGEGGAGGSADGAELQAFREKLAGGDEAVLKQLGRYKSIDAISRGFREAYNSAKTAGKNVTLTDKSTPEEVKAFRAANGIPDEATAYPGDFREGFAASDADKAILGDFKAAMHAKNVPPSVAGAALDWYQDFATAQQQQLDGHMVKVAKETQTALRNEWGGEYDGNIAAADQLMTTHLGQDGYQELLGLRFMDGSRLQDHPGFVKMMAQIGSDYYGGTAILTGDVEATSKTVQENINELLKLRETDERKYFSDEVQGKLTKLYAQRDKINARKG